MLRTVPLEVNVPVRRNNPSTNICQLQCQHLIHALNEWTTGAKYMTTRPIATQFPGHGCMNDQLNVALILKLRGSLVFLTYCFKCFTWVIVHPDTAYNFEFRISFFVRFMPCQD